jgi:hypothetical protein
MFVSAGIQRIRDHALHGAFTGSGDEVAEDTTYDRRQGFALSQPAFCRTSCCSMRRVSGFAA